MEDVPENSPTSDADTRLYLNPNASIAARVEDLLGMLTIDEKGYQLDMLSHSWGSGESYLENGEFSQAVASRNITPHGQGSLSQRADDASPRAYAESSNGVQRLLVNNTRLGIPALFISETLHGLVGPVGTTVFPQAIGLGATWNPDLLEEIGAAIAEEARAIGSHVGLSPVLDVCRDPRWGRLEETYGEDPHLVSRLGVAMVRGLQREDGSGRSLVATLKHFAGHGAPQGGRDSAPVGYGREYLREFALPPFEAGVREGNAGCVMAAYSDWCYVPCSASNELLTGILRDEWGFDGFVIEDMGAIRLLEDSHSVAADQSEAARLAIEAGVDQSFASEFGRPVVEAIKNGLLDEDVLDQAVRRILSTKFRLGLFENPYVDPEAADAACDTPAHRMLALEAARQSVVLLKNEQQALPLPNELAAIAVIGPNADTAECGDYSGRNVNLVTPLDGIRAKVGESTEVLYAKGCDVSGGVFDQPTAVHTKFLTPAGTTRGFAPQPGATGLLAEYFDNPDLAGEPCLVRVDAEVVINRDPLSVTISAGLQPQHLSVRWSGVVVPEVAGTYDMAIAATDGVRLTLDGELVIDSWDDGPRVTRTVSAVLQANEPTPIVIEWYSRTASPEIQLQWSRAAQDAGEGLDDAVQTAIRADVAVVVVGGSGATSGEIRDSGDLELPGRQMDLIRAVHGTGTPTVVVHIGGRPNTMEWAFDHVQAAVAAWNPGEEGGTAIADVLFGDVNPSGKLPTQWPATTGQLPSTYDFMHTGRSERGFYVDGPVDPRYPFGHGLSYNRFEYGDVKVTDRVLNGEDVTVCIDVTNSGEREGTEVVQLYVRDMVASVKRPVRQLKGFERVTLGPGVRTTVTFTLTPDHLALWNADGIRVVEPGEFTVAVGGDCVNTREAVFRIEDQLDQVASSSCSGSSGNGAVGSA